MSSLTTRRGFVAASAALAAAAALPAAAQTPSGSVEIQVFRAGFIIGGSGGSGILHYQGRGYQLSIGGVSLGATIGIARADFVGDVFNLNNPRDIEGTYTAVSAGGAAAGGGGMTDLINARGVQLRLRGTQVGLMFSIDLAGMQITIRN